MPHLHICQSRYFSAVWTLSFHDRDRPAILQNSQYCRSASGFQLCSSQQPPSAIMLQSYSLLLWRVPYMASSSVLFAVQDCGQQSRHIVTFKSQAMWWSGCPTESMLCEEQSWSQLQHLLCCTGQQGLKRHGHVPELPVYLAVNSAPNHGIYSRGGSAGSLTLDDWEKKRGKMK